MRITTQRTQETEQEKRERQEREREAMRQAIAAYSGPVTKIPPGKTPGAGFGRQRDAQVGGCGKLTAGAISAPAHREAKRASHPPP